MMRVNKKKPAIVGAMAQMAATLAPCAQKPKKVAPIPKPQPEEKPTLRAVLYTLTQRLGVPILCHVKMVENGLRERVPTSAELRYIGLSRATIEEAFADLECVQPIKSNEQGWGATHVGIWQYVSPAFRVRFVLKKYKAKQIMLHVSTVFDTAEELAGRAARDAQAKSESAAKAAAATKAAIDRAKAPAGGIHATNDDGEAETR